jgi:predicted RNA polymerase sigma factor
MTIRASRILRETNRCFVKLIGERHAATRPRANISPSEGHVNDSGLSFFWTCCHFASLFPSWRARLPLLLFVQHSVDKAARCYVCDEPSGELTDS